MANWFENLLLRLLKVLPLSSYNRGQTKRYYYQQKKSIRDKCWEFQKRAPAYYKKLNKFLRKFNRRYFKRRLIFRDQRLFNGQVLAAEAFKWDTNEILKFLTDAAEDPNRFGVHRKHQQTLKGMIQLLLEHLRDQNLLPEDNHICMNKVKKLDRVLFQWEGVSLPCHSFYDVLTTVLSILGRAPTGATRHNHHLALLIILAKFLIVVAGDKAKTLAPNLVSIMFIDEEIDVDGLNIIMGATIPRHRELKESIRKSRYNFLLYEGVFDLLGKNKSWCEWPCGQCAETFALVLLKRNTTFTGKRVGGLSLKIRAVLEMDELDDVRLGDLEDPCGNCRKEFEQCDVDLDQFQVSLMV